MPLEAVYGMSRIDASGRVADRLITDVLNWQPGDRLTLTAPAGVVLARRDSCGLVTVSARRFIAIPAALRHRCGLRAGDRVLLAALPGEDALAVYTLAVVDQALRAHATLLCREGGRS
jgi:AbrB family looped-hinge helix DNA binding protein